MVATKKTPRRSGGRIASAAPANTGRIASTTQRLARSGRNGQRAVRNAAQKTLADLRGTAADAYQHGRATAHEVEDTVEHWISSRPFTSTLITLGVGLVLGRFWRRR